ncbi:hypothetical protein R6Q59_032696 [Mikania micrantha]
MGTKVKGFFKGLKNFSNIFDEDEDEEIQIGMPTDVKHIAHIGADGPATESPSWMKGFDSGKSQSGPMERGARNHRSTRSEELTRDLSDAPKASRHRHHRSIDNSLDHDYQSSNKPKHRRHHRIRRLHKKGDMPELPKRSTQTKSKDDDGSS